jgi:hypothetical protein
MYKSITVEEKKAWEYRAEEDKRRYDEEMKTYVPPHGYDNQGNLLITHENLSPSSLRKKYKDPNAPKRAKTAYVLFTIEYRPKIMEEHPGIKFINLGMILGEKWRGLSQEERRRFEGLAQEDKVRHAKEMEEYKKKKEMGGEGVYHNRNYNHHQEEQQHLQQQTIDNEHYTVGMMNP